MVIRISMLSILLLVLNSNIGICRSRFYLPDVVKLLQKAGYGKLILGTSADGQYVRVDCAPVYHLTKDEEFIDVKRDPHNRNGTICIVDTVNGVVKIKIPFDWKSIADQNLKNALVKHRNMNVISVDYPLANRVCKASIEAHVVRSGVREYRYTYLVTVDRYSKRSLSSLFIPSTLLESCESETCERIKPGSDIKEMAPYSYYYVPESKYEKHLGEGVMVIGRRRPPAFTVEPGSSSQYRFFAKYPPRIVKARAFCRIVLGNQPALLMIGRIGEHLLSKMDGHLQAYTLVPSQEVRRLDAKKRLSLMKDAVDIQVKSGWINNEMKRKLLWQITNLERTIGDMNEFENIFNKMSRQIQDAKEAMCSIECKSYYWIHLQLLLDEVKGSNGR